MLKSMISNFIFDRNVVLFAITNVCNCRCEMCSIWKQKNKKFVTFKEAKRALSILYRNNFRFLQLTGGEPLINPDFFSILDYAKKLGFTVFLVTNGTMINERVAKKLSENEIDNVGVSFHHYDSSVFEKISGHKNILRKVLNAIKCLKKENISIEALFVISQRNKDSIERIVEFINNLNVGVSFCMPITTKHTSFSLGGDCVKFSKEELRDIILEIIRLKRKGYNIVNNIVFLKEVVNFLDGKNKYYCVGGSKIFYLDWNLNFHSCMFKSDGVKIDDVNFNFKEKPCNECLFQCFREPSLFYLSKPLVLKLVLLEPFTYLKFIRA